MKDQENTQKHTSYWLWLQKGRRELCYSKARLSHRYWGTPGGKKSSFFLSLLTTTGSREVKERTDRAGNKGKQEGKITSDRCVWNKTLPRGGGVVHHVGLDKHSLIATELCYVLFVEISGPLQHFYVEEVYVVMPTSQQCWKSCVMWLHWMNE